MEEKEKKKKKLPIKTYNLFGSKWTIRFTDKVYSQNDNHHWIWGVTDGQARTITLSTLNENDTPVSVEELKITILHEIVHSILETGQYMASSDDEPLVEWLARCLNQLLKCNLLDDIKNLDYDNLR